MYYVELDANNLAKWFKNTATGFTDGIGSQAKNDNNGYIVYFSDRRNNRNAANKETAEFGNEDIINPTSPPARRAEARPVRSTAVIHLSTATTDSARFSAEDVNAYIPPRPGRLRPRARHLRHGAQLTAPARRIPFHAGAASPLARRRQA